MNLSTRPTFGFLSRFRLRPGLVFLIIMLVALVAFEVFNYSTTDFALTDLLGTLKFAGLNWSTILAIAFCGIDFAGIARLFTPEQGNEEPKEVWYLFGAWLLAATMNAILTWWGVAMAIASHPVRSTAVLDTNTLTKVVPIFVAVMVWVIRVLIIGSLSVAGDRFLNGDRRSYSVNRGRHVTPSIPAPSPLVSTAPALAQRSSFNSRPSFNNRPSAQTESVPARAEPTYQSLNPAGLNARPAVRAASAAIGDQGNSNGERRM